MVSWYELTDAIDNSKGSLEWINGYIYARKNELTKEDIDCLYKSVNIYKYCK